MEVLVLPLWSSLYPAHRDDGDHDRGRDQRNSSPDADDDDGDNGHLNQASLVEL